MIRLATIQDLDTLLPIYDIARDYMRANGNPSQWDVTYPGRELLTADIAKDSLFVMEEAGRIYGGFVFLIGPDECYGTIEGAWKNQNLYGTIHRVASDGTVKGVFGQCVEFCREQIADIRVDTHEDNKTMQHLIEKFGFERCGIVYVADGSPRIAYQYTHQG